MAGWKQWKHLERKGSVRNVDGCTKSGTSERIGANVARTIVCVNGGGFHAAK